MKRHPVLLATDANHSNSEIVSFFKVVRWTGGTTGGFAPVTQWDPRWCTWNQHRLRLNGSDWSHVMPTSSRVNVTAYIRNGWSGIFDVISTSICDLVLFEYSDLQHLLCSQAPTPQNQRPLDCDHCECVDQFEWETHDVGVQSRFEIVLNNRQTLTNISAVRRSGKRTVFLTTPLLF